MNYDMEFDSIWAKLNCVALTVICVICDGSI